MRSEFEKLPEVKDSLSENIVFIGNKYTAANDGFYDLVNWLNGAWYAYQHQQSKLDELQKRVDAALAVLTEYYTGSYDESPDLVVDIEQALKGGEDANQ